MADPRTGPDTVTIGVEETDGTFVELASLDGKYLATEVAGGFTGRVIGMFAGAGSSTSTGSRTSRSIADAGAGLRAEVRDVMPLSIE